jgi:hypothetical protein
MRDKFRKASWRPPNHRPATTKNIAHGKSLWNWYVLVAATFTVLFTVRISDRVFLDIVSISALLPIHT